MKSNKKNLQKNKKMDIKKIIECIDTWLENNHQEYMSAPEANVLLEQEGLLRDRTQRPGKPLRNLLRDGKIPHAYKDGSNWRIPKSDNKNVAKSYEKTRLDSILESSSLNTKTNEPKCVNVDDDWMKEDKFRRVCDLKEYDFPLTTGMYAIMVDNENSLPKDFADELKRRNHRLLYIGITNDTLKERLWSQELHAKRPATFFRSIGALLGFEPPRGSMSENTRNYKFSAADNQKIVDWMSKHLLVSFISVSGDIKNDETRLINEYKPIINIDKNPYKMNKLERLREKCREIAWGKTI